MNYRAIFFLIPILGLSQNLIVSEIIYKGNTFTKDYIIKREIQHSIQVPLDSSLADDDKNRLINLGIFADVKWKAIPLESMTIRLEYEIIENDKFFGGRFVGAPSPGYDEQTGWSYGIGGAFKNFRGRNEQLAGGFSFGGRETFGLFYFNPWITGDHVSLNTDFAKIDFDHPYLPYRIKNKTFELNIGRYFGYERKTSIGFEIEDLNLVNDTTSINYQYFAPQGFFIYDTRDLYSNPTKGILFRQAFISRIDLKGELESSYTWFQSFSIYRRLSKIDNPKPWILAWGVKTQISIGLKDKNFMAALGESGSVRGWQYPRNANYNDPSQSYRFGFHNLKSSIELRKVLIPRFPMMDLYEFGVTAATFIDWGVTGQNEFSDILKMRPILGTGFSLQIQAPFVPILRFDYGWGFYEGKRIDKAFHIAAQHMI